MSSTAPWYAAAATIVILGVVGIAGGSGKTESSAGPTPIAAPAETAVPGMVLQVQQNPGLCAINISAGLRAGGETAKAHAIDAACSAVETYRLTGQWPSGFAP